MNSKTRFNGAIRGGKADRPPVLPKIWIDLACRLQGVDPLQAAMDPRKAMFTVLDAAIGVQADAARLFLFPTRQIEEINSRMVEIGPGGKPLGIVDMHGGWMTDLENSKDFKLEDEGWMAHNHFYPAAETPHVATIEDARRMTVPSAAYWDSHGYGKMVDDALEKAGDQICCIGDCDTPTLGFLATMRGRETALCDLLLEPDLAHACFEKGVEICIERAKFWIDHGVNVLRLNDSMANMNLISPEQWRTFIGPYFQRFCETVHRYDANAVVYCHICGNASPILEDLVDTGLDCIGPMDPLGGMTIAQARAVVGNRVALMGGVNTLSLLNGSVKEIAAESRKCIRMNGEEGAFILGSGCVAPPGTPRENLIAMADAAR